MLNFMKNIIITVAIVAVATVMSACKESNIPTIYVADYEKIQMNYQKYKLLEADVQRMKEQGDAEVAKLNEKLAQLEQAAQAIRDKFTAADTAEEKGRIETEEFVPLAQQFQAQQTERTRFTNDANQRIQALIQTKGQEIRRDIFEAVQRVAMEKGATYILEKNSIFYGDPTRDISDEIIERVNRNAPASSSVPAAPLPTPEPIIPAVLPAATPASVLTPVVSAPEPVATPALETAPAATPTIEAAATPAAEAAE